MSLTLSWEDNFKELFCEAYMKHVSGQDKDKCYKQASELLDTHDNEVIKKTMSPWFSMETPPTPEPAGENDGPPLHCWCAIKFKSGYGLTHLLWNPYDCCWDDNDGDDISCFSSQVAYWQPMYIPLLPNV